MSVDDELKQALQESEATAAPATTVDGDAPAAVEDGSHRNVGLLIGLVVACAAILFFVLSGGEDMVYAKQVNEVLGSESDLGDRKLRVQGFLVQGTLQKREEPCEYRFKIHNMLEQEAGQLEVHYASCIIPDTFRDVKGMDVEVTAEGKLASSGAHLVATKIFAKCPSKYEMQQLKAAGETAPHGEGKPQLNPIDTIGVKSQGS